MVQRTLIFVDTAKHCFLRCVAPKYRLFVVTVRCTLASVLFNNLQILRCAAPLRNISK
jgi:hypothetical protein